MKRQVSAHFLALYVNFLGMRKYFSQVEIPTYFPVTPRKDRQDSAALYSCLITIRQGKVTTASKLMNVVKKEHLLAK